VSPEPELARYVLIRPPCDWCSSPYRPKTATIETATTVGGAIARLCADCAEVIGDPPYTRLLDAAEAVDLITADQAAAYLAAHPWTYAKTVPEDPHEYLLIHRSADPWMHLRVIRYIRETGERRKWRHPRGAGSGTYAYWAPGDGWEYWPLGDSETVLNRRKPR
jgi:hypothetical protein